MTDTTSKMDTELLPDDPVDLSASGRIDANERRRLDNQIIATQRRVEETSLRGYSASWFDLDGASAAVVAGNHVCVTATSTVTKATSGALAAAGAAAGMVVQAAAAGTKVLVAVSGVVPPELTGLGAGAAGPVRVNTTTSNGERVSSLGDGDYLCGSSSTSGAVTIACGVAPGLISGAAELVTLVGTGTGPAGAFAIGDVVCSANDATDKTKVKLATAANLANAGSASVLTMLETGTAGQQKQAAGPGDVVAASVLGLSPDTSPGWAVLDTSTGRALRVTTPTTQLKIGPCDKQGNTTIAPRASTEIVAESLSLGVSDQLASDGSTYRVRPAPRINFLDVKVGGTRPDKDGAVSSYAHLVQALRDVPNGGELELPPGTFLIDIGTGLPPGLRCDYRQKQKRDVTIRGHVAGRGSAVGTTLLFRCAANLTTTTGTFISRATSGTQRQWRMGGWTGLTRDRCVGRLVQVTNCKNSTWWLCTDIYDGSGNRVDTGGTVMSLQSSYFNGGSGTQPLYDDTAASGTIFGMVLMDAFDYETRNAKIKGIVFAADTTGGRFGSLLKVANPGGPGSSLVTISRSLDIAFSAQSSNPVPFGMRVGNPYVPMHEDWTVTAVSTGTSRITATHVDGYQIPNAISSENYGAVELISDGTLPSPLVGGQLCWAKRITGDEYALATTQANAVAGTYITLTTTGSGNMRLRAFSHYYQRVASDGTITTAVRAADTAAFGNGNCSEGEIDNVSFSTWAGYVAPILFGSTSGQAVGWKLRKLSMSSHINGILVPDWMNAAGHFDLNEAAFTGFADCFLRVRQASRRIDLRQLYTEQAGLIASCGSTGSGFKVTDGYLIGYRTRPDGAMFRGDGPGPFTIEHNVLAQYDLHANDSTVPGHLLTLGGASSSQIVGVHVNGNEIANRWDWRGSPATHRSHAEQTSDIVGQIQKLLGTEELDVELALPATPTTLQSGNGVAPSMCLTYNASGAAWTNETTDAGSAANADVPLTWATVGGAIYVAFPRRFCRAFFDYANGVAGIGGAGVWEYYDLNGTWTAFTGISDATSGFTAAVADGLEVSWSMQDHTTKANTWHTTTATAITGGAVVDATQYYWARFRTTQTYSTSPTLDQVWISQALTFTFKEADIVNAAAAAVSQSRYLPWVSTSVTSAFPPFGSDYGLPLFGAGAARLNEVLIWVIAQAISYQGALYDWPMSAVVVEGGNRVMLCSAMLGMSYRTNQIGGGSRVRMKVLNHARAGKVDMAAASATRPFSFVAGGIYSGALPTQLAIATGGVVGARGSIFSSPTSNEVNASGSISANKGAYLTAGVVNYQALPEAQFAVGRLAGLQSSGVQRKRARIYRSSTARYKIETDGAYPDAELVLSAATSQTIDLGDLIPPGARFMGANVQVDTAWGGGGAASFTVDVGFSGASTFCVNGASAFTTGAKGEDPATQNHTAWMGRSFGAAAVQLQAVLTCDVNLSTLTTGDMTIDVFYTVQP